VAAWFATFALMMEEHDMNPIRLFYFVSPKNHHAKLLTAEKPSVSQLLFFYVLPLSLIPCIMM